ncbi:MAG: alpha/beta hydrolase [Clostridia bacterium]|nr:alpha/beta hydrolase [Clostridia bacterium]
MAEAVFHRGLVSEENYASSMEKIILPFLKAREEAQTVPGKDGKPLSAHLYRADDPRGTVVMVHGFTECALKFSDMVYGFLQNRLNVVIYDQRGHGYSWRHPDLPGKDHTWVGRFQDYVDDLEAITDTFLPSLPRPCFLFGHSMGGAVSALFLESHPDVFDRAILSSPMIAPHTGGIPVWVSKVICRAGILFGKEKQRIFVSQPYHGPEDFDTSCATSRERFDWYDRIKQDTRDYQNSCPTYRWTLESLNVTRAILKEGAVEKLDLPVLVFQADQDTSVQAAPQKAFADRLKHGTFCHVDNARHEIYRSTDDVLFPYWDKVLDFYEA